MIRFIPDTWLDAVLRPVAMAAPNSWVYIEVIAPDFRFVFLLALLVGSLFVVVRKGWISRPTWVLVAFLVACFVPWLFTTGNGRYFIPLLLASGVLCVALVKLFPLSRGFRFSLVMCMVGLQGFAVSQNHPWRPWNSWGVAEWASPPYFELELDAQAASQPITYVTLSVISYSLIAPLFPPESRWINLSGQLNAGSQSPDVQRSQKFMASSATSLQLLIPSMPDHATSAGLPDPAAVEAVNALLGRHRLALGDTKTCRLLPSTTLARMTLGSLDQQDAATLRKLGFWVCPLQYPVEAASRLPETAMGRSIAVFEKLERLCPRFFIPGLQGVTSIPNGDMRHYQGADMKLYVFRNGEVYYKYYRALNPVKLGVVNGILEDGYRMDCNTIRGRAGLPWEREI